MDLALNNLKWLICYKTKPNQIIWVKSNINYTVIIKLDIDLFSKLYFDGRPTLALENMENLVRNIFFRFSISQTFLFTDYSLVIIN